MNEIRVADTSAEMRWRHPKLGDAMPRGDKVLCLTKYRVVTVGKFNPEYHAGYAPLPKVSASIQSILEKMNE